MKNKILTKALVLAMTATSLGIGTVSYADVDINNVANQSVDVISEADKGNQELKNKQKELNNKIGQVKGFSKRRELRKSVREADSIEELDKIEKEIEPLLANTKEDKKDDKESEDSFEEEKEKAIKNFKNSKGQLTVEAQKDGIKEVLKTNNKEELDKALAKFNPQGPPEEYPTTAEKYSLTKVGDDYHFKIDNNDFTADKSGNLALDRNYTNEIPKADLAFSELNAYISKYIVNQDKLSLRDQAEVENKIDAFNEVKKQEKLDPSKVIKAHKELNDKLITMSEFEYKDDLKKDNEVLNELLKDIDNGFNRKGSDDSKNETGKENANTKVSVAPKTKTLENNNNGSITEKSNKESKKAVNEKSNKIVKSAGNNAKTGVAGLTGVVGVLTSASVAYVESKKNKHFCKN